MELFGIAVTILAGVLTYQAWQNGRWMKQAHQEMRDWMKQAHHETQELIKAMHSDMAEAFRRAEEKTAEVRKASEEARKETAETLREIARLIVAEGEKTRQAQRA